MRVLFATAANDPFIERVEAQLARELFRRGHDLLLLVEGRDPPDSSIPTIDTQDWVDDLQPTSGGEELERALTGIIADSRWYADACGYAQDRTAIEEQLVFAAAQTDQIIARYRPHLVLTWNGLLNVRAVIAHRAKKAGIPVLFCERGALPGSWCADPRGVNAASSIADSPLPDDLQTMLDAPLNDPERAEILTELDQTARAGASAWEQANLRSADAWRSELGIEPEQPVLFFPMQVDADTNMRFFSPHFGGSLPALEAVAKAVRSMPGWFLLVKPHPKGSYPPGAIEHAIGSAGRWVADINLHDALSLSALVVTINSTVACEAAWSGKPVLQLGNGILSGKGIVADFNPARPLSEQFSLALQHWQQNECRRDRSLRFYRFLRDRHLLQVDSEADACRLISRLEAMACPGRAANDAVPARAIADAHVWEPARCLLERMVGRGPLPQTIVLAGFGRNALKVLQIARRYPELSNATWSAWDDCSQARDRAVKLGLSLSNPAQRSSGTRTLFVLTPRHADALVHTFKRWGYQEGQDFDRLFTTILPADAIDVQ